MILHKKNLACRRKGFFYLLPPIRFSGFPHRLPDRPHHPSSHFEFIPILDTIQTIELGSTSLLMLYPNATDPVSKQSLYSSGLPLCKPIPDDLKKQLWSRQPACPVEGQAQDESW
jgi:hypothetical protein